MNDFAAQSGADLRGTARMKRAFGRRMKLVRYAMDCETIREFADRLKIPENTAGAYEAGLRFPSPPALVHLKKETGYTIDFLYADDKDGLTGPQRRALADAEERLKKEEAAKSQG